MVDVKKYISFVAGHDKKLALLVNDTQDEPFFCGVQGARSWEEPVANILHQEFNIKDKRTLFLNYEPSELELGMVWRAQEISALYYIESKTPLKIGTYHINQDGYYKGNKNFNFKAVAKNEIEDIAKNNPRLQLARSNPITSRPIDQKIIDLLDRGLTADSFLGEGPTNSSQLTDADFINITLQLADKTWVTKNNNGITEKPSEREAGHNIAAIMVDKDNNIIAWGVNSKSLNKTFHAETLMIQRYLAANSTNTLPKESKIYSSLQCCHMCAGHITTLGQDIKVMYAQKDPFFNGLNALQKNVNGCQERNIAGIVHALHSEYEDYFAREQKEEDIITFLQSNRARNSFNNLIKIIDLNSEYKSLCSSGNNNSGAQSPLHFANSKNQSPVREKSVCFFSELKEVVYPQPGAAAKSSASTDSLNISPASTVSSGTDDDFDLFDISNIPNIEKFKDDIDSDDDELYNAFAAV